MMRKVYPHPFYPAFCGGFGQLYTGDVIGRCPMCESILQLNETHIELCLHAAGFARAARSLPLTYLEQFWVDDVLYSGVFGTQVSFCVFAYMMVE
jgi:hypothetical protein